MQHPNTGQAVAPPRLPPCTAPSKAASKGAAGRRRTLRIRLPQTEDDGVPFCRQPTVTPLLHWTGAVTPAFRRRIERDVELLIAFLDALDALGEDLEDGGNAEPSLGWLSTGQPGGVSDLEAETHHGESADEEDDDPAEHDDGNEPSDANDMDGDRLTNAAWCPL